MPRVSGASSAAVMPRSTPPLVGRSLGDPSAPAVRIVALDPVAETATVSIGQRGNVIVLELMPGRDVEVIYPTIARPAKVKNAGAFSVDLGRLSAAPRYSEAERAARARHAQAQCEAARATEARRAATAARAVRRDSTGKVISGSAPENTSTRDLSASCDHLTPNANRAQALRDDSVLVRLPPREARERYLVVYAFSGSMSLVELNKRLATFTAVAPDVPSTIEAIATGIFAGGELRWSAHYVNW